MSASRPGTASAIAWNRSRLLLGVVLALPAVLLLPSQPQMGLALAVGILPVAGVGLAPRRRGRVLGLVVAAIAGGSLLVGSLLGQNGFVAVVGIFLLSVLASIWATRGRIGQLALSFAVPLVGMGFSFDDPREVVPVAGLMVLSGAYAVAVALLWPEWSAPDRRAPTLSPRAAVDYGIRLGLAGATAAALGFGFDVDHKGWMCGAALIVMRPSTDALTARSIGRAGSVLVGGFLGSAFMIIQPGPIWLAIGVGAAITLMAATQGSRWYVTPAFTTFVVFALLLYGSPDDTLWRFAQRTLETLVGVGLALFFGLVVPLVTHLRPSVTSAELHPGAASPSARTEDNA